jgi:hypothetical protein
MRSGQRKYHKEFIVKVHATAKPVKHTIEVDFVKLGIGLTRRLAFTTLLVNVQQNIRSGICSEIVKECIHKGAIKLDID